MVDFAVFILTHGRPDNLKTLRSLARHGYTGPIYLLCDDLDPRLDEYKALDLPVYVFDKKAQAAKTDCGDNFGRLGTITHARNASYQAAKDLGVKCWVQLDDDYTNFDWRFYEYGNPQPVLDLDRAWGTLRRFYESTPATTVAMAQGGDFIGGANSSLATNPKLKRKAMNSFMCMNDRPLTFVGTFNEDVNTYTSLGSRGTLFLTVPFISLTQTETQSAEGGITELYKNFGTYVKAFSTITMMPSCVRIAMVGDRKPRLHHNVLWRYAVPKILSPDLKKAAHNTPKKEAL